MFALWSVPGMLSAVQMFVYRLTEGRTTPISRLVVTSFPGWWIWAVLTPLVLWVGRRVRLERPLHFAHVMVHIGAWLGVALVHGLVYSLTSRIGSSMPSSLPFVVVWGRAVMGWMPVTVLAYGMIIGVGSAMDYAREARERALRAAALETQLAQAQLSALRMQLHPHFLFNTLHAIGALVREQDTAGALRVLSLLADVLRRVLKGATAHEVPLTEEVAVLAAYLEIEQVRFQDRLRVSWSIDDDVRDAMVPSLVLQPLVENAIRHGIARRTAAERLEISARRRNGAVMLSVRDDGPGLPPGWTPSESDGVGLANTRARLERLYGGAARLELDDAPGPGALATVTLPYRAAPPSPGATGGDPVAMAAPAGV